jgi:hypothetical protein
MADEPLFQDGELPSGAGLVEEGLALGATISAGRSAFCRSRGVRSEVEWKRSRMAAGELERRGSRRQPGLRPLTRPARVPR